MRKAGVKLEYWVFYIDWNKKKPKRVNILEGLEEEVYIRIKRKKIGNREELKDWLKIEFMYHYWSKSEYEYALGSVWWKTEEELGKYDVWYQIEKNLDMITDYIMYKMRIDFKKGETESE